MPWGSEGVVRVNVGKSHWAEGNSGATISADSQTVEHGQTTRWHVFKFDKLFPSLSSCGLAIHETYKSTRKSNRNLHHAKIHPQSTLEMLMFRSLQISDEPRILPVKISLIMDEYETEWDFPSYSISFFNRYCMTCWMLPTFSGFISDF